MPSIRLLTILFAVLLFSSLSQAQTVNPGYADGQLFWRIQGNISPELPDSILAAYQIQSLICPFSVLNPTKLKGGNEIAILHRTYKITFSSIGQSPQLAAYLKTLPITEMVEKVPTAEIFYTPNDPQYASQWNLSAINASQAWDLSFGNPNVRVAVVDDAVRTTHQDLFGSIWQNPGEIPGNGVDDDGNGYVDDVKGYDVSDNDNNPNPPLGSVSSSVFTHGTHCAGIVGAATNNGIGIASIGFGLKIIPVKCNSDATPGPSLPNAWDGVTYAITLTPEVMSLSWGGPASSFTYQSLINVAYANGTVVVAAAGNSNSNIPMYPASYNNVISVAGTGPGDVKAWFSNYGPTIDVSAPGLDILSTLAGSDTDYGLLSGTSMACPLVAGLCGLMKSFNPQKTVSQIDSCLRATADNINAMNPGFIGQLGAGRINAFNALQCVSGPPIASFQPNYSNVCAGSVINFTDQSYGNPTSWSWSFPGGTPSTSTLQNPSVTYSTPGTYSVQLTVSNILGTDTYTFNSIIVGTPTASMSGGGLINPGSPAFLNFSFTGAPPYSFTYTDGTTNYFHSGIYSNTYTVVVSPSVNTVYSLVSMNSATCAGTVSGTAIVTISNGCGAAIDFQDIFGGPFADNPASVKQTPDCGYIVAGQTFSFGTGLHDAFLTKLDQFGSIVWMKTYGDGSDYSYFRDVIPVSNGYVGGGYRSANNQGRVYVVKTDLNGNFVWERQIQYTSGGGAISGSVAELIEMSNGDILISGSAHHSNFNTTGQLMIRLDGITGATIWQRLAQVNNYEGANGAVKVGGGSVVQAGYSRSTSVSAGLYDMVLTKRDGNGNLLWSRNYGGPNNEYLEDLVILPDQGFLAVGHTDGFSSSVADMVVIRTDSSGTLLWSKKYARPAEDKAIKIVPGCNGRYFIAGDSRTAGNGNDALLMQIDINGNLLWSRSIGGILDDADFIGLDRTGDCGCILTLSTLSFGVGDNEIWVAKADSLGNLSCHTDNPAVNVSVIAPQTRIANPTVLTTNQPINNSIPTIVMTATPEIQDSVCDACGHPIANFDFVTNVLSLALIDASVNGQTWHWEFNDGSPPDTMRNAVHVFPGPGNYTVTLIVSSPCGSDTLSKTVNISGLNECLHVLQPGPVNGIDAYAFSRDDATNTNTGTATNINIATWSWSGNIGTMRSYLQFDLSNICNTATLLDARFSANYSTLFGQPHSGANTEYMYKVTSPWDEYAVTWLNQPTFTTLNSITVPPMAGTINLTNLNVTPLFQSMINGPNYGFMWRLQTEGTYRRTMYCSSDWPDPTERPKLVLKFDPIFAHAHVDTSLNLHSVTICEGDSIQLHLAGYPTAGTIQGPSTATRYLWVPSYGLSCDTCPDPWAFPDSTITYKAVAYNCPSCADIDTIRVTVSKVSVASPDHILCIGDSVQLNATHPFPNHTVFTWTPGNSLTNPNIQNPEAFPNVPTWYDVKAVDTLNGCVSHDSVLVLAGAPSPLPPMINDTLLQCNNDTVIFALNMHGTPLGSDFYEWNLVGNITPDPNSPNSNAIINTNIYPYTYRFVLSVTNSFGCVTKDSVDVIVDCILPIGTLRLEGEALAEGNHLSWWVDKSLLTSELSVERLREGNQFDLMATIPFQPNGQDQEGTYLDFVPQQGANTYRLKALDANGTIAYSEMVVLFSQPQGNIMAFPNPTSGKIRIQSTDQAFSAPDLIVFNALGKEVLRKTTEAGKPWEVDFTELPVGPYWIKMTENGRNASLKILKQN